MLAAPGCAIASSWEGRRVLRVRSVIPREVAPWCVRLWLEGLEGSGWVPFASNAGSKAYSSHATIVAGSYSKAVAHAILSDL